MFDIVVFIQDQVIFYFWTFLQESPEIKYNLVLNEHNNVKHNAQFLINIFDSRSKIVTKLPSIDYATSTNNLFHLLPQDQCPACAFINAQ